MATKKSLFVFNIFIGVPDKLYVDCMKSQKIIYPNIITIDQWGDCPIKQPEDPWSASQILRMWILSQHNEALYIDADIELKEKIKTKSNLMFVKLNEENVIDYCMIYHKNRSEVFKDMLGYYEKNNQPYWPFYYIEKNLKNVDTFEDLKYKHHFIVSTKLRNKLTEEVNKLYG